MKHTGRRVGVLFLLHALWAGASHAELTGGALPADEISRQSAIYQSRGDDVPKGYVIGRSLSSYLYVLPSGFTGSLAKLGPDDRWLDIGAGEGRAVMDYCTSKYDGTLLKGAGPRTGRKAQAVAMSIEDRRTAQWHQTAARLEANQLQYLFGRRLREYSPAELGKFQVITDVMGGFSYAQDLSLFMEKALAFLDLDGSFYTVLQDVRTENTSRPYYAGSPFLTEIVGADGSEVRMCSWLKSISCVEVTCEAKPDWSPPLEVYRIRKTCDKVEVPSLTPVHFAAGTPPERRFRLKE